MATTKAIDGNAQGVLGGTIKGGDTIGLGRAAAGPAKTNHPVASGKSYIQGSDTEQTDSQGLTYSGFGTPTNVDYDL